MKPDLIQDLKSDLIPDLISDLTVYLTLDLISNLTVDLTLDLIQAFNLKFYGFCNQLCEHTLLLFAVKPDLMPGLKVDSKPDLKVGLTVDLTVDLIPGLISDLTQAFNLKVCGLCNQF